jgi:hypothetical protein
LLSLVPPLVGELEEQCAARDWTFNGQRTSCAVRIARLMLAAAHQDWSDERIEQELLVRIEAEGQC